MMELNPGDIVNIDGLKIKAVRGNAKKSCGECFFCNHDERSVTCINYRHVIGICSKINRSDRKDIIFKEI